MDCARWRALAIDAVRFVGDNIAFVVAETIAQAKDAAELIDVNYEVLPAITDTIQSTDEAGPQIWEGCPDNLCFEHHFGDKEATDAAFAAADHVVKQRMTINRVAPSTMENRVTVADYDSAADRWTMAFLCCARYLKSPLPIGSGLTTSC